MGPHACEVPLHDCRQSVTPPVDPARSSSVHASLVFRFVDAAWVAGAFFSGEPGSDPSARVLDWLEKGTGTFIDMLFSNICCPLFRLDTLPTHRDSFRTLPVSFHTLWSLFRTEHASFPTRSDSFRPAFLMAIKPPLVDAIHYPGMDSYCEAQF